MNEAMTVLLDRNVPAPTAEHWARGTTASTSNVPPRRFSTVDAVNTMRQITEESLRLEEQWADYMREKDCDPKDGWVLVLPVSMKPDHELLLPIFVHFSELLDKPVFSNLRLARVARAA